MSPLLGARWPMAARTHDERLPALRCVLEPNAEGANKRQLAAARVAELASSKPLADSSIGVIEAGAAHAWLTPP